MAMTGTGGASRFSASAAALGYLYQCRLGLVCALRRLRENKDFHDVVFERNGEPADILQAKHHRKGSANLTDASADIWKTLRIWCEGVAAGTIPQDAALYLVSTSTASEGHAPAYLRATDGDPKRALERLISTAQASTNPANAAAYAAFGALSGEQQSALLERVYVLDASPNILDSAEELRAHVRLSVSREHLEPFLRRLEGWWLRRAIQQLADPTADRVLSDEFEDVMDELREQFKRDALPIDQDILDIPVDDNAYQGENFVQQLRLIDIGARRVLAAVREYFRAYEQRSRWLREELLLVGELDRYEQRLTEEWDLMFSRMKDDLGEDAAEEGKVRAAKDLYAWVESEVLVAIRPRVTERFITRGSYHMLADRLSVGWHPDFMERLQHLLEQPEAAS